MKINRLLAWALALVLLLGVPILWVLSLYRGAQMIRWAKQTRSSDPRPEHLITANPWRLGAAGVSLIVLPIIILSVLVIPVLFPPKKQSAARAASDTKTVVTQAIVYDSARCPRMTPRV